MNNTVTMKEEQSKPVPLMLAVSLECRNTLRIMAAEQNRKFPNQVTSASTLAREILCDYINKLNINHGGNKNATE